MILMNHRLALAGLLTLWGPATLTASITYVLADATNISFADETTAYQTGSSQPFWTEQTYPNNGTTTQQIVCVVGVASTSDVCGNGSGGFGAGSAHNISIPITNYLLIDGDPEWGAPVAANLTALIANNTYSISFYQASTEENGNNVAYNDSWQAYLTPSPGTAAYLCPQSYCATTATQTQLGIGNF
jgi:hypothetical protein